MSAQLSSGKVDGVLSVAEYKIRIAYMDLIRPDSDRSEKQSVVNNMHNLASQLVITLMDNTTIVPEAQLSRVSDIRIDPFFTFDWNSHLTAGVMLEFSWATKPTWICADIPASPVYAPDIAFLGGNLFYNTGAPFDTWYQNLVDNGYDNSGTTIVWEYKTIDAYTVLPGLYDMAGLGVVAIPNSDLPSGRYTIRSYYNLSDGRRSPYSAELEVAI